MAESPTRPERGKARRAAVLSVLLYAAILPAVVTSLLSLFGSLHWVLDLLSHFRVQHLAWFAAWALAAILLRRRNPAILAVVFALATAIPVSHYLPQRGANSPDDGELRVVSFNVLEDNPERKEVTAWLLAQDADIIVLPEYSYRWLEDFKALDKTHPHSFKNPGIGNFGLVIYSRWPITARKRHLFCARRIPALETTIDFRGTPIRVFGIHPMSPISSADTDLRNEHLGKLTTYLESVAGPCLVAGDFNTTVYSSSFKSTVGTLGLVDAARGRGNHPTYEALHPFFGLQIDHILHSGHFESVAFRTGPRMGSDHRPVVADLKLK